MSTSLVLVSGISSISSSGSDILRLPPSTPKSRNERFLRWYLVQVESVAAIILLQSLDFDPKEFILVLNRLFFAANGRAVFQSHLQFRAKHFALFARLVPLRPHFAPLFSPIGCAVGPPPHRLFHLSSASTCLFQFTLNQVRTSSIKSSITLKNFRKGFNRLQYLPLLLPSQYRNG